MPRKRRFIVILTAAMVTLSLPFASAETKTQSDWPQFHYDAAHTGFNPQESTLTVGNVSGLNHQWSTALGSRSESSPAVVDGTVFVGADDGNLYAIDAESGVVRWTAPTGAPINLSSPAVDGGRVFIGSATHLYAFDTSTGAELWNVSTGAVMQAPPTVANDVVYAASDQLYALDAATGHVLWTGDTGGPVLFSAPAAIAGNVYTGAFDTATLRGVLSAFDASTGSRLWTATTFGAIEGAPVPVGDLVYVASGFGIQAFDTATGTARWGIVLESNAVNTPSVIDGVVYVASESGRVYALHAVTGATIWSTSIRTQALEVNFSSPAVANGVVYFGSSDAIGTAGQVWALDATTGSILWSAPVGAYVRASLAVVNGHVYVSADRLYLFTLGDLIPPELHLPGDITVATSNPAGSVVTFDISATDNADPNPQVTCDPASGNIFPVGETTITCTATDNAGNTATGTFKVTVLRALAIEIQIDKFGLVNTSTGVATVTGTLSCSRPTTVDISGELKQRLAHHIAIDGFFSISLNCAPPASPWAAVVTATNGQYGRGPANASVAANGCDQFSCDFATEARKIILRTKR